MKRTKNPPKTGQFVAVWEYNNQPWSITVRYAPGGMQEYNSVAGEWASLSAIWPRDAVFYTVPLN